jgi:hypothetical protein
MDTVKAACLIGLLISGACLQAAPTCSTAIATNPPVSIRVPTATGYSFPAGSAHLLRLNTEQNSKEIRKHAWAVFAGIIQDSIPGDPCSPPIWDTWFNVLRLARDQENSAPKLIRLDVPLETVAAFFRDGTGLAQERRNTSPIPANSEMILLQLVVQALHNVGEQKLYNSAAHDWIVNNDLLTTETLTNQLKAVGNTAIDQRTIPAFPPESIIVKAKWQSITNEGPNYVWYWNDGSPNHCHGGCFEKVTVRKARSDEPCNLPLKKPADIHSTCFYTVNDDGQPGNSLILLGLHVMTKEISDWTWSTFWWSPDAGKKSKFSDGRFGSTIIPGLWRNYLMDTTLSMSKPEEKHYTLGDKPLEADACHQNWSEPGRAKIDFNPYIEVAPDDGGGMLNARLSNCMNCHKRSSYPGFNNNNMRGIPWRGELRSDTDCFADQLRLDYLWSLSPLDPASKLGQFYFHVQQQLNASAARLELR